MEIPLNFATYYQIILKDKTPLSQIDTINILLTGDDSKGIYGISDDMTSNYATGAKPVSRDIVKNILDLSPEELSERIDRLHIQRQRKTIEYIKQLLLNGYFDIGDMEADFLLHLIENRSMNYFFAELFIEAINSPRSSIRKLNDEEIDMLNNGLMSIRGTEKYEGFLSPDDLIESVPDDSQKLISTTDDMLFGSWGEVYKDYYRLPDCLEGLQLFCTNYEGIQDDNLNNDVIRKLSDSCPDEAELFVIKTIQSNLDIENDDFICDLLPTRIDLKGVLLLIESKNSVPDYLIDDLQKKLRIIPSERIYTRIDSELRENDYRLHIVIITYQIPV